MTGARYESRLIPISTRRQRGRILSAVRFAAFGFSAFYAAGLGCVGPSTATRYQLGPPRTLCVYTRQLGVASAGISVSYQRHAGAGGEESSQPAIATASSGYITLDCPVGLALQKNLSAEERLKNFDFLWTALDRNYGAFDLKKLDWQGIGRRYRQLLAHIRNDGEYYWTLFRLVNELRDTHSFIVNYPGPLILAGAGVETDLFGDRAYVVGVGTGSEAADFGVKPGWEVIRVDGLTVADRIEALRAFVRARSSERGFRANAARLLTAGEAGSIAVLEVRSPNGDNQVLRLQRRKGIGAWAARPPPLPLTMQRYVHFGRHSSGVGYIWIQSFNERAAIADEFDCALESLRDAPALVLDIRGNPGGFAQPGIVGRFLSRRILASVAYIKSGPGRSDFRRQEEYLGPTGSWQYSRPAALLINRRTGSAADLFAAQLRSANRVITVGETTEGDLSGFAKYAVLPCGLIVRFSNAFVCDAMGHAIEGGGNEPNIMVSPTLADVLAERDPVLEAALKALLK